MMQMFTMTLETMYQRYRSHKIEGETLTNQNTYFGLYVSENYKSVKFEPLFISGFVCYSR